jgi:hypothetical protein
MKNKYCGVNTCRAEKYVDGEVYMRSPEINKCEECAFISLDQIPFRCNAPDVRAENREVKGNTIPNWCPLPNVEIEPVTFTVPELLGYMIAMYLIGLFSVLLVFGIIK